MLTNGFKQLGLNGSEYLMNISTYIIIIGVSVALSTGSFFKAMEYLVANPIPTWLALSIIVPVFLFGLLAVARSEIDFEEDRAMNSHKRT